MNEIGGRIYNDLEYTELAFSMETKQMMNSVSRAVWLTVNVRALGVLIQSQSEMREGCISDAM